MTPAETLVAPFPYFGGKRRAAPMVWDYFGEVDNYVEPFCGSLAVLLAAPNTKRIETVNDVNGFLVNFWRAVRSEPEAVAQWADWPVSEIDLEARHGWLVNRAERLRWSLEDPDFYDCKMAGWWVWGACSWIGSGWCLGEGPWISNGATLNRKLPHVGDAGMGINRKLPHVGDAGMGINRQLPHVGNAGRGSHIREWFERLSQRLRDVRIICGDWARVVTPVVTTRHGKTAVFLDPPYSESEITKGLYQSEGDVAKAVRQWCVENSENTNLRIILCGYLHEHKIEGWKLIGGKATNGGYGNSSGNKNHKREAMWISPTCETNELALA